MMMDRLPGGAAAPARVNPRGGDGDMNLQRLIGLRPKAKTAEAVRQAAEAAERELAARASGSRRDWEGLPERTASALAASLGVAPEAAETALRAHVSAELERHAAEALREARRAFGLA